MAKKRGSLLIVDDIEINRIILQEILQDEYDITQAEDGIEAISLLFNDVNKPSAVLLDIMMPEMDGYEVLEHIKENPETRDIPVIFITAADANINERKGLEAGAVEYIEKPFNTDVVKLRVNNQVELKRYRDELEQMVDTKVSELIGLRERMLETMATIIEYRNLESGQHVKRVTEFAKILIHHLSDEPKYFGELNEGNYNVIIKAVPLHDIGKISIPDSILLKPGNLDKDEYEVIKTHSAIGSDIIDSMLMMDDQLYLRHCRDICRHHHERWDGNGYPDGLAGREIPLSARIVAIVDVYDALVSPRVYKPPFAHEKAIQIISEGAGTQFDPDLVKALLEVQDQFVNYGYNDVRR